MTDHMKNNNNKQQFVFLYLMMRNSCVMNKWNGRKITINICTKQQLHKSFKLFDAASYLTENMVCLYGLRSGARLFVGNFSIEMRYFGPQR